MQAGRTLKNLLSLAIGLIAAFMLLELLLRVFPSRTTGFGTNVEYRPDARIGITLAPGMRNAVYGRKCIHNSRIRTNSLGFRDDEWNSGSPPYRIAIIGDSFMEALQVPDGALLPDLLEEKLGGRADVQNFGIAGFGTVNEYLAYMEYARPYHPDLVLLFFSSNDVLDNCEKLVLKTGFTTVNIPAGYRDGGGFSIRMPPARKAPHGPRAAAKRFLKRHCRTLIAAKNIMAMRGGARKKVDGRMPIGWYTYMPPKDGEWVEAWEITEHFLARMASQAAADGARFMVFTVPYYERVCDDWRASVSEFIKGPIPEDFDPFYPSRRIADIAARNGIDLIELEPEFMRYREENGADATAFYYMCDGHFNETGHAVAAEAVYRKISPLVPPSM